MFRAVQGIVHGGVLVHFHAHRNTGALSAVIPRILGTDRYREALLLGEVVDCGLVFLLVLENLATAK